MNELQNLTGRTLGKYELRAMLNRGGMGAVYKGFQSDLGREVAVKVLPPALASEANYLERFNREAKTAASLEHPHIVPVYDFGVDNDISYVVMRLLTGGSLTDRLVKLPPLGLDEINSLLRQLCDALDYAHSHGVVHRDIKPSNVMFDQRKSAYLVDFGIAKLVQSTTQLTSDNTFVGTPAYMAPEQWKNEKDRISQATDQYALAAMIYQLLSGTPPFEGDTPYSMMHGHLTQPPTPLFIRREGIPQAISSVVERGLAKLPEERFPSCGDFANAFSAAVHGAPAPAVSVPSSATPADVNQRTTPANSPIPTAKQSGNATALAGQSAGPTRTPQQTTPVVVEQPKRSSLPLVLGGAVAAIVLIVIVIALLSAGNQDQAQQTQTAEAQIALALSTNLAGTEVAAVTTDAAATLAAQPTIEPTVDPATLDTDEDGLNDAQEARTGTDPATADTDEDGLSDGEEVRAWRTDPLNRDTDGDTLLDGDEAINIGTDPTLADTDGDGILDVEDSFPLRQATLTAAPTDEPTTEPTDEPIAAPTTDPTQEPTPDVVALANTPAANDTAFVSQTAASAYDTAISLMGQGDWEQAREELTRAIEDGEYNDNVTAELYFQRAMASWALDDPESALEDLSYAVGRDPSRRDIWNARGQVNYQLEDYTEAINDMANALASNPNDGIAHLITARSYLSLGNLEAALESYTLAHDSGDANVDNAWAHAERGYTYEQLGDYASAESDFTAAIDEGLEDASVFASRAEARINLNDGLTEGAVEDLLTASALDGENPYYFRRLGEIYDDAGDSATAQVYYQIYVDLGGDSDLQRIEQRLAEIMGEIDPNLAYTSQAVAASHFQWYLQGEERRITAQSPDVSTVRLPRALTSRFSGALSDLDGGRFRQAAIALEELANNLNADPPVENYPLVAELYFNLGRAKFGLEDWAGAHEAFTAATSYVYDRADILQWRAITGLMLALSDEANAAYNQLAVDDLESAILYAEDTDIASYEMSLLLAQLGGAQVRAGLYVEAADSYERAADQDEPFDLFALHISRGEAYLLAGEDYAEDALSAFEDAEDEWADSQYAARRIGDIYYEYLDEMDRAADKYRLYFELGGSENWDAAQVQARLDNLEARGF